MSERQKVVSMPKKTPIDAFPKLREHALVGAQIREVAAQPVDWFWRDIAAVDHHIEIAGPSYVGKTTLAALLAVAAANATGTPVSVLGHEVIPVPEKTYVVIVEEENSARSMADKLEASCEMLGLPVDETLARVVLLARKGVNAHAITPQNERSTLWGEIIEMGNLNFVGFLLLDSRARVLTHGDSNSDKDQAFGERIIQQAIAFCECPVAVVSHTRKSGAEAIEDLAGSHQRAAGADTILLVNADREDGAVQSSKVVFAKLRDSVGEHPEPASFSVARDADGRWHLALDASARESDQPAHERMMKLLTERGAMTKVELRKAMNMSGARLEQVLTVLFTERRVKKTKTTRSGREQDVITARTTRREVDEMFGHANRRRKGAEDDPYDV